MTVLDAPVVTGAVSRARASVAALRVLKTMRDGQRTVATADELVTLSGWSGWGPLAPVFAPKGPPWDDLAVEVSSLLSAKDVDTGHLGTFNAFYTPRDVAASMWDMAAAFGYTHGPVLEPGCGGGVFMETAPAGVVVDGVELDPTAAAICEARNPQHRVIHGELQGVRLDGGYALAIGNVPFGKVPVWDPAAPDEARENLHNYFIWRTLSELAPGGIAILLTSRFTLDAAGADGRKEIAKLADFLGAVRLANGDLGGGTAISADILVFRRREPGRKAAGHDWLESWWTDDIGRVNQWWTAHPEMSLGEMKRGKTDQYGLNVLVERRPDDLPAAVQILHAGADLVIWARKRNLMWKPPADVSSLGDTGDFRTPEGYENGQWLRTTDGGLARVDGGKLARVTRPGAELMALVKLRDLAVALVTLEADHDRPDADIEPLRVATRVAYEQYVGRYGFLNRCKVIEGPADEETGLPTFRRVPPQMGGFRTDPDAALVFALEVFDDETSEGGPAPILTARQNVPPIVPTETDDPKQALAWSLNYRSGKVDVDYIAGLLRIEPGKVGDALGDLVFTDPATRKLVTTEEYLSGNVRRKYASATAAAEHDEAFRRHVDSLANVLPRWLGPADITANLGAPWIPTKYVASFVNELLCGRHPTESDDGPAYIRRMNQTNQWEVSVQSFHRETVAATGTWGTEAVDAFKLVQLALNGKTPVVKHLVTVNGEQIERKDDEQTMLACEKQQMLRERFCEWVWERPERTKDLEEIYNNLYNSLAPRTFDGSHITIDGMAPGFVPYAHQLEFVARAMATRGTLCGHPVGGGKTKTMAMVAMKLRQAGLITKPMIVVPNHLIDQTEREVRQLFPAARVMAAGSKTISANRRAFAAKVATRDWDIIIVPHSAFDRMPLSEDTEVGYLSEQQDDLRQGIREACPDGELEGRMVKAAARRLTALKAKINELHHRALGHDKGVTFEQLAVDYILVDEAHYYKNLSLSCRTDGFSVRPSKRATDLDMKLRYLSKRSRGGHFGALFTGTPISNTMLELYVVMHYLMPDYLREVGMPSADAWAAAFVQFVTTIDVTIDGGNFQLRTKPALFVNAPELRMMLSLVADIRTADQLGLERPGSDLRIVAVEPTGAQQEYSAGLVARAEAIKGQRFAKPGDDNMLAICGDGRRMATDPVLVKMPDDDPGKIYEVARSIVEIWREHPDELQIAFCDLGTPRLKGGLKDTQTYGRLRRLLTDMGMPVGRIRFIHDARNDAEKAQTFSDCRAGKVSVIIGSTDKLGVGTNIQNRVVAMHHIDAPFRPADVEQRDGRGLRPGNRHALVRIFRYVTKRTFDAYMWQLLTTKIGFISQMMSGSLDRTVEDVSSDAVLSYSQIKAAATDQPLLLEKAKVDAEIKKLRNIRRAHRATIDRLRHDLPHMRSTVESLGYDIKSWEAIAAAVPEGGFTEEHSGQVHKAMEGFQQYMRSITARPKAKIGNLTIWFDVWRPILGNAEIHPRAHIGGGAGDLEFNWFRFWEPVRVLKELNKLAGKAQSELAKARQRIPMLLEEIANSERVAAQPFERADELARIEARLAQIEEALHAAATGQDYYLPDDAVFSASIDINGTLVAEPLPDNAVVVEAPAADGFGGFAVDGDEVDVELAEMIDQQQVADATEGDVIDLDDIDELFGELMASLEDEVGADFADLFGEGAFA